MKRTTKPPTFTVEIKPLDEERCSRRCRYFHLGVSTTYCALFGLLEHDGGVFFRHDDCVCFEDCASEVAHKTTSLVYPRTGELVLVDVGLKKILPEVWAAGIATYFSCYGHPDHAYLVVDYDEEFERFASRRGVLVEKTLTGMGLYAPRRLAGGRKKLWDAVLEYARKKNEETK